MNSANPSHRLITFGNLRLLIAFSNVFTYSGEKNQHNNTSQKIADNRATYQQMELLANAFPSV